MAKLTLKEQLEKKVEDLHVTDTDPEILITVVKLPNGALETIANYQNLDAKIAYLQSAYDEQFCLRANPDVQIQAFILI